MKKDLVSLIFRALQSEFEAVQIYKEVANEARAINKEDVAGIFDEIARDEFQHIGNLEKLLKDFEAEQYDEFLTKLHEGMQETAEDLQKEELDEDYENFYDMIDIIDDAGAEYHLEKDNDEYETIVVEKSSIPNPSRLFSKIKEIRTSNKINISYSKNVFSICLSKK